MEDNDYKTGKTSSGIEFIYDLELDEIISKYNWQKRGSHIYSTSLKCRLDILVLKHYNKDFVFSEKTHYIRHINGNKLDSRIFNLEITDKKEIVKRKNTNNKYGLTGLIKKTHNKFNNKFNINGFVINSKLKDYKDAYVDNLIIQRHYGLKHNESEFYKIESISQERIDEVISLIDEKLNTCSSKQYSVECKNTFKLSDNKDFYEVYCTNGKMFKISIECIDIVKQGNWIVSNRNGVDDYIIGKVSINGKITTTTIHRYLMDMLDNKYSKWCIDHINRDKSDNRLENLIITNHVGNMINKTSKMYNTTDNNMFVVTYSKDRFGRTYFSDKEEAIREYNRRRDIMINERLEFKNKAELDLFLNKS